MPDALLVLNAGSSSLKFSVFRNGDPPRLLLRGQIDGLLTQPQFLARTATKLVGAKTWKRGTRLGHRGAVEFLLDWGRGEVVGDRRISAVGHRVAHGGTGHDGPCLIDAATLAELDTLCPLAPLQQPHNIAAIRAVIRVAPELTQVACFDTAFHSTQPAVAKTYGLPRRYAQEGVLRYGFHGLSYEYVAWLLSSGRFPATARRTIVAHLGNGASMCAIERGRSLATTMGFTSLDGLVMGTRCGAIDPGVLLYLLEHHGMTREALRRLLYEESGLLGVSGISGDMRELLASTHPHAAEAVDLFVYRVRRELGSLAAALGGLDALVFTGGIGERAPAIRLRICREAGWLGVQLDQEANARGGPCISRSGSGVSVWVIPTNEELMIAMHTRRLLLGAAPMPVAQAQI
jgi:acetate kinase